MSRVGETAAVAQLFACFHMQRHLSVAYVCRSYATGNTISARDARNITRGTPWYVYCDTVFAWLEYPCIGHLFPPVDDAQRNGIDPRTKVHAPGPDYKPLRPFRTVESVRVSDLLYVRGRGVGVDLKRIDYEQTQNDTRMGVIEKPHRTFDVKINRKTNFDTLRSTVVLGRLFDPRLLRVSKKAKTM